MADHDIRVVPCRDSEVGEVQHFVDQYWRRGHILARNETLLRWQHDPRRAPRGAFEGPSILLARDEARIVGMLGLICGECNIRGTIVPAAWMAILLSIPEVRRQAAGLKLLDALSAMGFEAIFVLGINDQVKQIYRRLGYEILEDMPRWLGAFDADAATRLILEGNPDHNTDSVRRHCENCLVRTARQVASRTRIEVVDWSKPLGETWDGAWTELFAPQIIGTNRDSAYLNWRYVNHPSFRYLFRVAQDVATGRIEGLAIARVEQIRDRTEKVLRILELLATPDAAGPLAESVVKIAKENEVAFADFYCTCRRAAQALEMAGFRCHLSNADTPPLPSRLQPLEGGTFRMQGAFLLAGPLREKVGPLLASDDFYVTKSDGDMDRPN